MSTDSQRAMVQAGGVDAGLTPDTRQLNLHYRWSSLSTDLIDRTARLRAGDRAPDAPIHGSSARLFDVFRGPYATVLGFGNACGPTLASLAGEMRTCLITDEGGDAFRVYQADPGTLMVVRPDGYLAMTADVAQAAAVTHALPTASAASG